MKIEASSISDALCDQNLRLCMDAFDDPEALATEQHVFRELTSADEIRAVCVSPEFEASVTLAFIEGERRTHFIEPRQG